MAHFAQLDDNNMVINVIVVNNDEILDNNIESEIKGIQFCENLLGGKWIQTSYNGSFRKNYAGIGFKYDAERDAFIPPKPFNSWLLNEETCNWQAPKQKPDDGENYIWDEDLLDWIKITNG